MQHATRAEAERLLGIAEKLLQQNRDLMGCREFAILAQETEPLLEGSDQILAIVDVLLASEKRVNNTHPDWYAILAIDRRSDDLDLIKKQYRRLALLLHPDKNRFSFADVAFKLVADAWALFSDPVKKSHYDKELSLFSRVDLSVPGWVHQQEKLPVRRTVPGSGPGPSGAATHRNSGSVRDEIAADENSRRRNNNNNSSNNSNSNATSFWTACPYCYRLYEYARVYEGCCLKCANCERSFHGVAVPTLPPLVPGEDAYYCCWGFFPMGFVVGSFSSTEKEPAPASGPTPASAPAPAPVPVPAQPASSLPNWMPAPTPTPTPAPAENGGNSVTPTRVTRAAASASAPATGVPNGVAASGSTGPKKRGRPRKYA